LSNYGFGGGEPIPVLILVGEERRNNNSGNASVSMDLSHFMAKTQVDITLELLLTLQLFSSFDEERIVSLQDISLTTFIVVRRMTSRDVLMSCVAGRSGTADCL